MTKKQKVEVEPQIDTMKEVITEFYEDTVVGKKPTRLEPKQEIINDWEIKDRRYVLTGGNKPLSYSVRSKGLYTFDSKMGYEREITYAENQTTPYVDEFKGQVRLGRIVFRNGVMFVPKVKVGLQKFLSIYHPSAGKLWQEVQPRKKAVAELDTLNYELDAMLAARELDIDIVEAIMRVQVGSKVTQMTSKELKRDILIFAKNDPYTFLGLCDDDNIHLRNIGIKSVENGLIRLSSDQRTFTWVSSGRMLMNVPFEEHPYNALAAWFKTDEGMEVLKVVEKQLK
jgi:hypothetical protein